MKLAFFLPALAALGLAGCVTGYGYSDDGYYYGRSQANVGSYGSIGYGSPGGWRFGYGMGYGYPGYYGSRYGYPGYFGYYDPYSGYYYDPWYGYYFPRPPVVIIQRPPGDGHDDHDGDHHPGHPPPWRDLDDIGDRRRRPYPTPSPSVANGDGDQPRVWQPPNRDRTDAPRPRFEREVERAPRFEPPSAPARDPEPERRRRDSQL